MYKIYNENGKFTISSLNIIYESIIDLIKYNNITEENEKFIKFSIKKLYKNDISREYQNIKECYLFKLLLELPDNIIKKIHSISVERFQPSIYNNNLKIYNLTQIKDVSINDFIINYESIALDTLKIALIIYVNKSYIKRQKSIEKYEDIEIKKNKLSNYIKFKIGNNSFIN